ncbi:17505_t:CDS:2 [Dentiscutata erythropus]|uniref:17505_t:CDS:1 n=1 Tax=Dentiscutata erythropus TaxID=1348616 RepID=A0A9N9BQR1_9GLOM|nr:17505_t:CDS:2 [Dentiscutata erythropus]
MKIQYATQYKKKLEFTNNYLAHLSHAQKEHDYYNINIKNAVDDSKYNQNIISFQESFKTFNATMHITYDWAQNTNYIIDDAEMPNNVSTINRSTSINFNFAQYFLDREGFQYYNFKIYFEAFKKLLNIQKYYHFYFTSQNPGVVFYKDDLE